VRNVDKLPLSEGERSRVLGSGHHTRDGHHEDNRAAIRPKKAVKAVIPVPPAKRQASLSGLIVNSP